MEHAPVDIRRVGSVGVAELARPDKFNCLSRKCFETISNALTEFEADRSIRALLIQAQGKNFCTGADLEEVNTIGTAAAGPGSNSELGHDVLERLERSRLPVVVAVQGLCLAGGLELMMAADVAFAATSARFGDQHARYGLIPGWGGSQRLPRLIGLRRAMHLFYTAKWVDANTAEQWGLVNVVVPDEALQSEALAYCTELAKKNPEGIALMKRLARQGLETDIGRGLAAERAVIPGLLESDGVKEGLAAFMGRREPNFP